MSTKQAPTESVQDVPKVELVQLPKKLPEGVTRETLLKIGNFMMDGLEEEEACLLAGMNYEFWKKAKQTDDGIAIFIQKKMIEFKHRHLKTVQSKGDSKTSQWLLESLRPEQFGVKKKPVDPVDALSAILKQIQKNNQSIPVKVTDAEVTSATGELSVNQRLA